MKPHARPLATQAGPDEAATSAPAPAGVPRSGRRRVLVRDLEVVASVGVYEHEKRYEQRVVVSLEIDVEDAYDGRSDRLEQVLDYGLVVEKVTRLIQQEHVHLIETLAERIAELCLASPTVTKVRVRIEKPDVLPSVRSVGVEIERG
ncbi:MAG: dihydroneopterin aldolase, partial [Hyphomicrobiaceae bacterium]|nr:dihydroneopterin aldolase [Hyphomicrobiaceae bacterium]